MPARQTANPHKLSQGSRHHPVIFRQLLTTGKSLGCHTIGQETRTSYVEDTQKKSKLIIVNKRWKKPPPTHKNKKPTMLTCKQTEKARLQSEKKAAEAALKMQMEKGKLKGLEEKKARDAERKQEEELRKQRTKNANYKLQRLPNPRWYLLRPKWRKTGWIHQSTPIYRI
jgi:hypothetical protein